MDILLQTLNEKRLRWLKQYRNFADRIIVMVLAKGEVFDPGNPDSQSYKAQLKDWRRMKIPGYKETPIRATVLHFRPKTTITNGITRIDEEHYLLEIEVGNFCPVYMTITNNPAYIYPPHEKFIPGTWMKLVELAWAKYDNEMNSEIRQKELNELKKLEAFMLIDIPGFGEEN